MDAYRSNCLVWALKKWSTEGGYLAIRRSQHWRFIPHFLWSKDLKVWLGFTPLHPNDGAAAALFMWWFLGTAQEEVKL